MSKASAEPTTGVGVGLLVASAMLRETFESSLSSRSVVDQGVITGMSSGLHYLLTVGTQDALQAVAAEVVAALTPDRDDAVLRRQALTLGADLAVIPVGLLVRRLVPSRPGEAVIRGAVRQAGWRLSVTGIGGALLVTAEAATRALDQRLGGSGRVAAFPVAVPVGLAVAYALERRRVSSAAEEADEAEEVEEVEALGAAAPLTSLAVSAGVVGGLAGVAYAEHLAAVGIGRGLAAVLPGGVQVWKLAGHGGTLAVLAVGASALWQRAVHKLESGTVGEAPVFGEDEGARWTGPTISGGPGSLVPWESLGREGRRHALTHVRAEPLVERPRGLPDLSISTVMGEPAKAAPAQVYVGLDAAPTPRERVDLALAEMERVGAFDRSLIMLTSPTGTGYVNYVAMACVQYLTRGDMASVTLQYSKRPSPLSLRLVGDAREQNRLLWLRVLQRLRDHPGPRPKVVLFGESLGAHTSQDVFLHWGTLGPQALGIDRALWIGTPYLSGWMHEVTGPDRLDVDPDLVGVFNDFEQLEALEPVRRARLRYVLVSHDNDGVTKFGPDLLTTQPRWLGPDRPRREAVPGASPRGIPPRMRWLPLTTFFQSLIDMKNAQVPGEYRAWAHDYRPDLPRFIQEVYDLDATPKQLAAVAAAVERRESLRAEVLQPG